MIGILLYILGAAASLGSFLYLNKHYKWIKRKDLDDAMPAIVFGTALWPIALLILVMVFVAKHLFKFIRTNMPE